METEFKNMLLGEWKPDEVFELFVRAWIAYHKAADEIDGHIEIPVTKWEHELVSRASKAGSLALSKVLDDSGLHFITECKMNPKWNSAKKEAFRRLKK